MSVVRAETGSRKGLHFRWGGVSLALLVYDLVRMDFGREEGSG